LRDIRIFRTDFRSSGCTLPAARAAQLESFDTRVLEVFEAAAITATDKPTLYAELAQQARGLLHGEPNLVANAANFAALAYHALPDVNWCGFYFLDGGELVVGPFQGRPACIRIAPLVRADGTLLGVWDVDSPNLARFDDEDRAGMEALCAEFMRACAGG
jgi:GAF domain-containing protein